MFKPLAIANAIVTAIGTAIGTANATANARFVTPAMLDPRSASFDKSRPLFDLEHALRDADARPRTVSHFHVDASGTWCASTT